MSDFSQQTISEFLGALSSSLPAPGGGAAIGLTAAQAAALLEMVVHVSGEILWASTEPDLLLHLKAFRQLFLDLARDDAEAFNQVMASLRMKKEDPNRTQCLEQSLKNAAKVPISVMEALDDLFPLAEKIGVHAKKQIISDVGVAIHCANAAMQASVYNVRINLKSIRDENFVETCREKVAVLIESSQRKAKEILKKVDLVLGD